MSGMGPGPWRGDTAQSARAGSALKAATGRGSSALKYDILTALLVTSAQGPAVEARLALRLSLLITARFNWRLGTFSVGQREMARMWGVTERTAKREMAQMRALSWIAVSVPAARGRVAQYRILMENVLRDTTPHWAAVGPDFVARMSQAPEPETQTNVVPLRAETVSIPDDGTVWSTAAQQLNLQDPAVYSAWLSGLVPAEVDAGTLVLVAPSAFVASYVETHYKSRLLAAVLPLDAGVRDVRVIAG